MSASKTEKLIEKCFCNDCDTTAYSPHRCTGCVVFNEPKRFILAARHFVKAEQMEETKQYQREADAETLKEYRKRNRNNKQKGK